VGTTDINNGVSSVYVDLAKKVLINGQPYFVNIVPWTAGYNDMRNYKLYAIQLTNLAKAGRKIAYFGYSILFPSGGANITYSQIFGTGYGPDAIPPPEEIEQEQTQIPVAEASSHTILGLSKEAFSGVVAGSALGVLLVIFALVYAIRAHRRNKEYPAAINETTDNPHAQNETTGLQSDGQQHTKYQALV